METYQTARYHAIATWIMCQTACARSVAIRETDRLLSGKLAAVLGVGNLELSGNRVTLLRNDDTRITSDRLA